MIIRFKWLNICVTMIILVLNVTVYKIIEFSLYEYAMPVLSNSIIDYINNHKTNLTPYVYPSQFLSKEDYHKLININFTFEILNKECENNTFLLIIMVHSAPGNFLKRHVIRETWGQKADNVFLLFALGSVDHSITQAQITEENRINGDIIQGSFKDAYKNLTYKHVMLFKYLIYHCPNVKYLLKTDDDIFINSPTVINFLKNDLSSTDSRKCLFCLPSYSRVVRSYRSESVKWRLSYEEYPKKYHPPSCLGIFLIYSQDVIFDLYRKAQHSKYFWIDDLFITGHLFEEFNILHVNARPYMIRAKYLRKLIPGIFEMPWPFLISGPDLNETQIRWLWEFVQRQPVPYSILDVIDLKYGL